MSQIVDALRSFLLEKPYIHERFLDAQYVQDGADIEICILADTLDCNKVIVNRLHTYLKYYCIDTKITLPKVRVLFIDNNLIQDRYIF